MSSEEAIQEVRRIFVNNSVEQAYNYLTTITRSIQESDERLKNIVGQSYRDLITACDKVVGMERTCKKLLRIQKRLQSGRTMSLPFSTSSCASGVEMRDPLFTSTTHHGDTERFAMSLGGTSTERVVFLTSSGNETERNAADMVAFSECRQLLLQQRCIAMEGLLGTKQIKKAALVLRDLREFLHYDESLAKKKTDAKSFHDISTAHHQLLESYANRLRHVTCDVLRKDADDAAQRSVMSISEGTRFLRGDEHDGDIRRRESGVVAGNTAEGNEWMGAMTHMADSHMALGVLFSVSAPGGLLKLIELIFSMVESELQLITEVTTRTRNVDSHRPSDQVTRPLGMTEWLRVVLPLPEWLHDDSKRPQLSAASRELAPAEQAKLDKIDIHTVAENTRSCNRNIGGRKNDAAIALHIAQRSQYLFFHLVAYVASVAPDFFIVHDDGDKEVTPQYGKNSDAADDNEEIDAYMSHQRRHRSLQSLLTLRGRLITQRQQQQRSRVEGKETGDLPEQRPIHMSGNSTRDVFAAASCTVDAEGADHSLDTSASVMHLNIADRSDTTPTQMGVKKTYLHEVTRQVCGMQLLDPQLFCHHKTEKRSNGSSCTGNNSTTSPLTHEGVKQRLTAVQEGVSRLLTCIADAGLLRSPRYVVLQESLARQEGTRLQNRLKHSDTSGNNGGSGGFICLFDESKWMTMVNDITERALLKSIGSALRKADVVCDSILRCICAKGRHHSSSLQEQQQQKEFANTDSAVRIKSLTLSQLSQQLFSRSLCVSQLISAVHCNKNEKAQAFLSFGTPQKKMQDYTKERTMMDAMLARAVVKCVWSNSRSSLEGRTHGGRSSHERNGDEATERMRATGRFRDLLGCGDHVVDADSEEDHLFADDNEEITTEMIREDGCDQVNGVSAVKVSYCPYTGLEVSSEDDDDEAVDKYRRILLYMLQRIFDLQHVWVVARTSVQNCITTWISNVLRRVQEVMQKTKEDILTQQQQQEDFFGKKLPEIITFYRLSLLLEVLLGVVETAPGVLIASELIVTELRETIVACHMPWVELVRLEWESGLCTAYREAFTVVTAPMSTSAIQSLTARRFTLEYAACWYRGTKYCRQEEGDEGQTVAYPIHLTPHVTELLFTLQHILYTIGVGQHLKNIILPIFLRELLDGTAAAVLNVVLPFLTTDICRMSCDIHNNSDHNTKEMSTGYVNHINQSHTKENNNNDGEKEEFLLQLCFDLLFIKGVLAPSEVISTSSLLAVMQAIEERVDPVVWSLLSPLLTSASEELLRSTALSFGSWSTTTVSNMCHRAYGNDKKIMGKIREEHESQPFMNNSAIATPTERERFPLLPLTTTTSALFTFTDTKGRAAANVASSYGSNSSGSGGNNNNNNRSLRPPATTRGKETTVPSFTTSFLWGNDTTKGWVGSLW